MVVAKKKKARPPTAAKVKSVETRLVPLGEVVDNSAQSRGMGVLSRLKDIGYGVFEQADAEHPPLWALLTSERKEDRATATRLIAEHEPELVRLADAIARIGQLQPVGVWRPEKGGGYDVIFGMRRALAQAFNAARASASPAAQPVEAKVFTFAEDPGPAALRLMALGENDDREDESPIDRAMAYKALVAEGLETPEIADLTGQSAQNVRNYLKLLDAKIEDKRLAIHAGILSVDGALKLLQRRKEDSQAEAARPDSNGGETRHRLPGVKKIIAIYEAKEIPSGMEEEEWELWKSPDVRRLLALRLGLRYSEWKPPKARKGKEKEAAPADGRAGEDAAAGSNGKKHKVLKVKRARAVALLVSLGKGGAATWTDDAIARKLEDVVNIIEPGQKAETDSLQKLLDVLVQGYKEGMRVEILKDG